MYQEELIRILNKHGIPEAGSKAEKLREYMTLVLERNRQVNLTAITDPAEFMEKHYADSLSCSCLDEFEAAESVIDVGTGGGFPGVPLAICFPEKEFTLIDSLNKRILIIREFCEALEITNVTALHGRAEDLARREDLRERFDLCVSRAVANLRTLSELCLPFVRPGGSFIAYKGPDCEEETREAARAIRLTGGGEAAILDAEADGSGHRFVLIPKIAATQAAYPRRAGLPGKKPL